MWFEERGRMDDPLDCGVAFELLVLHISRENVLHIGRENIVSPPSDFGCHIGRLQ